MEDMDCSGGGYKKTGLTDTRNSFQERIAPDENRGAGSSGARCQKRRISEIPRPCGSIDDLSAARNVALRAEMLVEAIEQLFNNASLGELLAE
jgi:hypothetical protein